MCFHWMSVLLHLFDDVDCVMLQTLLVLVDDLRDAVRHVASAVASGVTTGPGDGGD